MGTAFLMGQSGTRSVHLWKTEKLYNIPVTVTELEETVRVPLRGIETPHWDVSEDGEPTFVLYCAYADNALSVLDVYNTIIYGKGNSENGYAGSYQPGEISNSLNIYGPLFLTKGSDNYYYAYYRDLSSTEGYIHVTSWNGNNGRGVFLKPISLYASYVGDPDDNASGKMDAYIECRALELVPDMNNAISIIESDSIDTYVVGETYGYDEEDVFIVSEYLGETNGNLTPNGNEVEY